MLQSLLFLHHSLAVIIENFALCREGNPLSSPQQQRMAQGFFHMTQPIAQRWLR